MMTKTPKPVDDLSDEERARLADDTRAMDEIGSLSATGDAALTGRLARQRQKSILGGQTGHHTTHLRRPSQAIMKGAPMSHPPAHENLLPDDDNAMARLSATEESRPIAADETPALPRRRPVLWIVITAILSMGVMGLAVLVVVEKGQHEQTTAQFTKLSAFSTQLNTTHTETLKKLDLQVAEAKEAKAGRAVAETKVTELTGEREATQKANDEMQQIVTASREEVGRLKGMQLAAQEKLVFLEKERSGIQVRAEEQAKQLSRIAAELRERSDETQQVRADLAKTEAAKHDAENRVKLGQDAISSLTDDRDGKVAEIAALTEKIEELKKLVARQPGTKAPAPVQQADAPAPPGSGTRPRPPALPPTGKKP